MKIVIAGERPFVEEIGRLCQQANHDVVMYLVEDFFSAVQSGFLLDEAADADIAIELHNESAAAKEELLRAFANYLPEQAVLMTSALATSTTRAASWVSHPERVVGFGVVPPIPLDGIVELARGLQTADSHFQRATEFWQNLGQEAITVADGPGLIRARTICCLINEAASALHEGIATAQDIDEGMKLGTNYPYGPLAWGDHIGLDAVLGVMTGLFEEWGEDRYRPSPLLKRMVLAGRLGKKTGEGFYKYGD
jgi:3-hydroxybutyryl-CoA dehydrogenase